MIRAFKRVFENAGWKLLALAVAVVIWALVASEPELATFLKGWKPQHPIDPRAGLEDA